MGRISRVIGRPRVAFRGADPRALPARQRAIFILVLALGGFLLGSLPVQGSLPEQDAGELPAEFPPPRVEPYFSHSALPQGGSGTLLLVLDVAPTFHIQINDFLELWVPDDAPVTAGPWMATELQSWHDEQVVAGHTALRFPITVKEEVTPGALETTVSFGYQGCVEEPTYACYPPGEIVIPLIIEVLAADAEGVPANEEILAAHGGPIDLTAGAAAAGEASTAAAGDGEATEVEAPRDLAGRLEEALGRGSLLAILLVFVGGILSSFTPCVYPMIPITISFVGGRARNRLHGFVLSLFFVLGIAIMYSGLGIVAASTGSIFGGVMQSAVVMIIVAVIFAAMGASMLGAFDIALPSSWQGRMTSGAQRGGFIGAILMGMVTGLVASPCIGPVLVVLLTFAAKGGNLFMGFWLLFTYAVGLGMLFLVLGTFAGAISALPGAGAWMDTVKHIFGVILLGMAIFFLRTIVGEQFTRFLLGIYLVFVGVFMGGLSPLPEEARAGRMLGKAVGMLVLSSGIFIFLLWVAVITGAPALLGLAGSPIGLVDGGPGGAVRGAAAHPGPAWRINDEDALTEAATSSRPAIQDFYADWCGACVELDEKTWIDPAIIAESDRFVSVKMDFTKRGEYQKEATTRYSVKGMPTVIFYDRQGDEVTRFVGFKPPAEVLRIMQSIQ